MKKVLMFALAAGLAGSAMGCAKKQTVKSDQQPVTTTPAPAPEAAPAQPENRPPPQ